MRTPTLILALTLALLPSLAVAGPLVITRDTKVNNTYRWLDGKTRDLGGMVYDGKDLAVSRNVIRFWDDGDSNTVVRNSRFSLLKPTVNPGDLPVALEYVGGHDHLIENVIAENFRSVPREKHYENGDCFSGERGASRITFRNVTARNCSDGGFDFKSKDVRYENATAEDAGKGFRVWGQQTASTITCRHWKERCIQMNWGVEGNPASFTVEKLILDPKGATGNAFAVQPKAVLNIKSCEGALPPAPTKVIWYDGHATPDTTDVTLCGVKVANQSDAQLRAEIEAKIAADATSVPAAVAAPLKPRCTFPMKLADRSGDGVITLGTANAAKCGGKANMKVKLLDERPGQYVYGPA